jgi:hypothetical protein
MCTPHEGIVDTALWRYGESWSRRICTPIAGALIREQMKDNSKQTVLYSISEALRSFCNKVPHTEEQLGRLEMTVCEAAIDRLCWDPNIERERDSNGRRQVMLRRVQSNDRGCGADWDEDCQNIFGIAIIVNNVTVFQELLNSGQVDVNFENRYFGRPLQSATRHNCLEILRILLHHGAEIHATQPVQHTYLETPLRWSYSSSGGSALRNSAWIGHFDVVKVLLQHSLKINLHPSGAEKKMILLAAAKSGNAHLVSLLEDEYYQNDALLPALREEMLPIAAFGESLR